MIIILSFFSVSVPAHISLWKKQGVSQNKQQPLVNRNVVQEYKRRIQPQFSKHPKMSCKKCSFVTSDPVANAVHRGNCNGKRHLTCSLCGKVLSRYDALNEHLRGMHGVGKKPECRFCSRTFKYTPQMYQHQVVCENRPHNVELNPKSELSYMSTRRQQCNVALIKPNPC